MKRRHSMPFGAECIEGAVRFRLWAPEASHVELCLDRSDHSKRISLERQAAGWFELVTDEAKPGALYKFKIDDGQMVSDPASRFQPKDVHGPSEVIDPHAFDWQDHKWLGRPWEEAVIQELHVGAFTAAGTFFAVRDKLGYLVDLGITAIELMPVSDFPGQRNWGYDGVLPFAPDSTYGRPEDLKELIQSAHSHGLMVLLDVVYNHFGPEGNYLNAYAPQFFTDRHRTPWGNGINFDGPESGSVRDFFINNALYWLDEYHFDGLRLDAVHAIADDSQPHILTELAEKVRSFESVESGRHLHLILENDNNHSNYLRQRQSCRPRSYTAQWNDDIHHALHVLVTGETDGYYVDYSNCSLDQLGRCLTEGFAYQGEPSRLRKGQTRGEPTEGLPPGAFISFLQNHDQIGNRPFGDRITTLADVKAVRAAAAILLLAPSPPMIFMGEEFGAETPFMFFCDFGNELSAAVTEGRRNEFAHFSKFSDPQERERIPDPSAATTFEASRLDWNVINNKPHQEWLGFYRRMLRLRRDHLMPRLSAACKIEKHYQLIAQHALRANWTFADRSELILIVNLAPTPVTVPSNLFPAHSKSESESESKDLCIKGLYLSDDLCPELLAQGTLPGWSVAWFLQS